MSTLQFVPRIAVPRSVYAWKDLDLRTTRKPPRRQTRLTSCLATSPWKSPAVGESHVVFGSGDYRVHCLGRDDGKRRWTFSTRGEVDSSPVICGDKVVVGSLDGRLYLLRLQDGKELWSYDTGEAITASPAVSDGVVVVGSEDGWVYAFGPPRKAEQH